MLPNATKSHKKMNSNLFVLPDELWISILHEWIDKPIILCAFDIAFCNRLLRERYLMWLHVETRGTFNVFSHIHFKTTLEHETHGMSHQGVPDTFFDWCVRKQINPKSLSYYFVEHSNESDKKWECKVSKEACKVMKQVEQLNAYYRIDDGMANADLVSNILDDCPKLRKLVVDLHSSKYHHSSNILTLSCKRGPYLLINVNFVRVKFPLSTDSFHKFVDACPNLEMVKFDMCKGINLYHILYLLNHANVLESIYVFFLYYTRKLVGDAQMNQIEEEAMINKRVNTTMKSLILENLFQFEVSNATYYLLSIFKKCPMLEKVVVDFWLLEEAMLPIIGWHKIIANNWQHMQSLTLQYAAWMISNELNMNALESCCGKGLKLLSI